MGMKIAIRVKPNARTNEVRQTGERQYLVSVNAPPAEGKANERVVEVLAKFFGKPKRAIVILRGASSRDKIVEIL